MKHKSPKKVSTTGSKSTRRTKGGESPKATGMSELQTVLSPAKANPKPKAKGSSAKLKKGLKEEHEDGKEDEESSSESGDSGDDSEAGDEEGSEESDDAASEEEEDEKPAQEEKGKARKRQRTGEPVEPLPAETKSTKKVRVQSPAEAGSTEAKQNGGTAAAPTVSGSGGATGEEQPAKTGFFSGNKFAKLPLSKGMLAALTSLKFTMTTKIQDQSIPPLLAGEDMVGAAKTGSGKTLAFLIPVLETLHKVKWSHRSGTACIIISPTRELSLQTYGVVRDFVEAGNMKQTHGLLIGGANRRAEAERLVKGVNILVVTPGRLLDHLQNTRGFLFRNMQMLVIDEADRILEQGFEEEMHQIIKLLPKERQTMLFSATQTKKVEDLARLSIKNQPVYVGVDDSEQESTVDGLEQGYVVCPSEKRFLLLFTFLKKNRKKKIMVFFSSCNSVKFHSELLNYIDIPVMDIHGRQKQQKRTTSFFQFCKQDSGVLLCTDVAARGLDIPAVDWIIQFDPPDQTAEYIHRVGRTARGQSGEGRALLFLLPEEVGFLRYLRAAKAKLNEYEFPVKKVANVQSQLSRLIEKNYYLNKSAREAYRSYLLAYSSHSLKNIYDVHELDLQAVARAFGFTVPPRVDLKLSARGQKGRGGGKERDQGRRKSAEGGGGGHAFSATNPYGKKAKGDARQFTH
eukprot:jgi/Undpi1/12759/HiC_scaffold_6.g02427.m1